MSSNEVNNQSIRPPPSTEEAEFLESLKNGKQFTEHERFLKLNSLFKSKRTNGGEVVMGDNFVIAKLYDRIEFNRKANVYLKTMHNKFFVPVWCAAFNSSVEPAVGYVLYPKLTPVKQMLCEVKQRGDEEATSHAVRLSLAPIALAIDALHTPIQNRRTRFYHRRICIDKVYVSKTLGNNNEEEQVSVYGEAMLKLAGSTRGSHEVEEICQGLSIDTGRMKEDYFHHPAPFEKKKHCVYGQCHDWFSFGVYILEVLGIVLDSELDRAKARQGNAKGRVDFYKGYVNQLKRVVRRKPNPAVFHRYIAIARRCIKNSKSLNKRVKTYKCHKHKYYLEYELQRETAELLILFDAVRKESGGYKSLQYYQRINMNELTCQACLIKPSVPLPLRAYRRGDYRRKCPDDPTVKNKCDDENCSSLYCAQCYTNGERMFCPMEHGTASTVIGHFSSFALILYGEQFDDSEKDVLLFKKDADNLSNALMHKMICGIPEDNVLVRQVYSHDTDVSAKDCLKDVCKEMHELIANKHDNTESDADYCLFIFYSGHGKGEHDNKSHGSWCTAKTSNGHCDWIDQTEVKLLIDSISPCRESRRVMIYVTDHCNPPTVEDRPDSAKVRDCGGTLEPVSTVSIAPEVGTEAKYSSTHGSDITRWLCSLLRSTFANECNKKGKEKECSTCALIKEHIEENCHNVYIDGGCLKRHASHMEKVYGFHTSIDINVSDHKIVLAHYQPNGVYYRIFSYKEDANDIEIEIDFWLTMSHTEIAQKVLETAKKRARAVQEDAKKKREDAVKAQQHARNATEDRADALENRRVAEELAKRAEEEATKVKDILSATTICLLTENEEEETRYSLVWESDLRNKLESASKASTSLIYYHLIKEPVKTILRAEGIDGEVDIFLNLNELDTVRLVNDFRLEKRIETIQPSQLPNILVHIVHMLFYTMYKKCKPRKRTSTSAESNTSRESSRTTKNQPTESDTPEQEIESASTPEERIRNSFARLVYRDPPPTGRSLADLDESDWHTLATEAGQYLVGERKSRPFTVTLPGSGEVTIQWKAD